MLLIHCKPENVERLARALKMPLPLPGPQYERRLRRAVVAALETDRRRAAAEEQRMKDKAEALKVAAEIAATLGEHGVRPIAQIRRIVVLMGPEWTREQATYATGFHADPSKAESVLMRDVGFRKDGTPRPLGGVFFAWCRRAASGHVVPGGISRRDYLRCFFDRPKKPRPAKPAPAAKQKRCAHLTVEATAYMNGNHEIDLPGVVQHRTQGGKGPVGRLHDRRARDPRPPVEVYVARRRA